jgi:hypothetical protein
MHRPEVLSHGPADGPVFFLMKLVIQMALIVGAFSLTACFKRSEAVRIPNIQEAPQYVSEPRLAFQGKIHPQLVGSYSWSGASTGPGKMPGSKPKRWRFVVPVTGPNWDKSQPVPLWMTFNSFKKNQEPEIAALQRALQAGEVAGINVDYPERTVGALRGKSAWQQAVLSAEQRHGLMSDPRAPIVSWRP